MPRLDGFKLKTGKLYAVGIGTKKKPVMTTYNVDMDQWYIRFGDAPWNHLGEFIEQNPGIEIDEIDAEGNQVGSDTDASPVGEAVDVMPALAAAAPVTSDATPAWME
jgi:hypothetical protein